MANIGNNVFPVSYKDSTHLTNLNIFTPSGSFLFIQDIYGNILMAKENDDALEYSTHIGLSGGADVCFAGSISFYHRHSSRKGHIKKWSNDSGHYQPSAIHAACVKLPQDKFEKYEP